MKEIIKRLMVLILAAVLWAGFTGKTDAASAKAKPSRPVISLKRSGNGTEITVTINKTSGAEGYRIYLKESGAEKYKRVKTLKKSGDEVRTYTIKKLDPAGTTDRVFLLSLDEVKNAELGFEKAEDRRCAPTVYAVYWEDEETECEGVWIWNDPEFGPVYRTNQGRISCFWWLRTPCTDRSGKPNGSFYMVRDSGKITEVRCWGEDVYTGRADYDEEFYIEDGGFGIRPAMVITVDGLK